MVGFDGTWNEPGQLDDGKVAPTNVAKFIGLLKRGQRIHYEEGVGTGMWERVRGGVIGYGLEERILAAYRFISRRFSDSDWKREQNRIFVLGFSRGAYISRRISGLIAHSGIPLDVEDTELGFELYKTRDLESAIRLKKQGRFFDYPIEMIGVWDTVKATNDPDYNDFKLCDNVAAGYHAMAIDETRRVFPVLRWSRSPRVTQVWFSGVHADVGGGYRDSSLSDIALEWMVWRAVDHGLDFRENLFRNLSPNPGGSLHQSYTGIWKMFGQSVRHVLESDPVHESVGKRVNLVPTYRPQLPKGTRFWKEPYRI